MQHTSLEIDPAVIDAYKAITFKKQHRYGIFKIENQSKVRSSKEARD